MTESPDPAAAWWSQLTPEVRKFWFMRVTGWSVEGAMKAAFAEATGELELMRIIPVDKAGAQPNPKKQPSCQPFAVADASGDVADG